MDILQIAREHYWDTLEPQKELVLKHLESIVAIPCEWERESSEFEEVWHTSCGQDFMFIDGDVEDNNLSYCPYCGRKLTMRAADASPAGFEDEEFDALLDGDIDGK